MKYLTRVCLSLVCLLGAGRASAEVAPLELKPGDRICLVGNALGEGLQHHGTWEAGLHQRFADHKLVVRNLCFPGDEAFVRPRSANFGPPEQHLKHSRASVVLFFFGFNESFAGDEGLNKFKSDLTKLVKQTQEADYSGEGAPRIALVSPIAQAAHGAVDADLRDSRNKALAKYTAAMREVADKTGVAFADVFAPTLPLMEAESVVPVMQQFTGDDSLLTIDGCQLSAAGYAKFGPVLNAALFGDQESVPAVGDKLVAEIDDKNFHWWHCYRAVNGYSIYGPRGEAGSDGTYRNREVLERELAILEQMCEIREERIWALARGEEVAGAPDDSTTLPFITPKTNVSPDFGRNGNSRQSGSLDYLSSAEQQKLFKLADGYEISLFASEEDFPEIQNPVSMTFDAKGRLWVAVMPSYPHWQPKTKLDDKLLILTDTDGDGRADECKTFAGGLHQPTGFELGYGGAFVAVEPDLLFLKDTDGDDVADVRVRRLAGFDSADTHHGLGTFEWTPGGKLNFQEGIFKYSNIETPFGLVRAREGAIWELEPRTDRFGTFTVFDFVNPWGHVFNQWGQSFVTDGTTGEHYFTTPLSTHIDYPGNHGSGGYPRFLKKVSRPSAGCEIISSRHFPDDAQGNYLENNVIGIHGVLWYTMEEKESGYGGDYRGTLVESSDGNFRPVDLQFGPDGALYICDWHNALIGHLQHNLRDPNRDHSHGRIWRVTAKDRPLVEPAKIDGATTAELLSALEQPELRTKYRARRELATHPTPQVLTALEQWIPTLSDPQHQLEALWVYQTHATPSAPLLVELLSSENHNVRAAAVRVLCEWRNEIDNSLDLVARAIADEHPRVRLEAVRACSFYRTAKAAEVALEVLNHPMDPYLQYALDETMKQLQKF
jgi:hypothetical protein